MWSKKNKEENKKLTSDEKVSKNKYLKVVIYSVLLLLLVLWSRAWWLLIFYVVIIDFFLTKKVNWTFWKKRDKPISRVASWIDALVFAGIAALLIRTLLIEAYTIPTGSMEKTLKVGDYLFVSKYHYGPRLPVTPLAVPFTHHTLPLTKYTPAFVDWLQCKYKRLPGLTDVNRDDIVVFNFPVGDTVVANMQATSYYQLCRYYGRDAILNNSVVDKNTGRRMTGNFGEILVRPMDKKDNYVKRCIAVAGDTLEVIDGVVFTNGQQQKKLPNMQYNYIVVTDGSVINPKFFEKLDISKEAQANAARIDANIFMYMPELVAYTSKNLMELPLTEDNYEQLKKLPSVLFIKKKIKFKGYKEFYIFPHTPMQYSITEALVNYASGVDSVLYKYLSQHQNQTFSNADEFFGVLVQNSTDTILVKHIKHYITVSQDASYAWNEDNFGPLWIPKANNSIDLTISNLPLYKRAIEVYEHNKLEVKGDKIFINDVEANSYTFKQDYFFMMGDNRHNSADSRFWGLVPEDHIVGTPLFIWLSTDKDKSFISKIRFNRLFTGVRGK